MRLRARISIVAAALMLCGAAAHDLFDDIYAKSHSLQQSIRTVTARFTEESTSALLTVPVVSRGTLAVVRPDRVVMRYSEPPGRVLLIDGDQLTLAWLAKGVHERSKHRRRTPPDRQVFRRQVAGRAAPELHDRGPGRGRSRNRLAGLDEFAEREPDPTGLTA